MSGKRAIFLDRDGVLVQDVGLLDRADRIVLCEGAAQATATLRQAGYALLVVTNQPIIARGLLDEAEVAQLHEEIEARLRAAGGGVDGYYLCPHHPNATVPAYRLDCDCRKPRPGLLLRAAAAHGVDLAASTLVGDRMSDVEAGARAGCRTVLVQTGRHGDPRIESPDPIRATPDHVCADLRAAAAWILEVA